jgi:hypothetical protein
MSGRGSVSRHFETINENFRRAAEHLSQVAVGSPDAREVERARVELAKVAGAYRGNGTEHVPNIITATDNLARMLQPLSDPAARAAWLEVEEARMAIMDSTTQL